MAKNFTIKSYLISFPIDKWSVSRLSFIGIGKLSDETKIHHCEIMVKFNVSMSEMVD